MAELDREGSFGKSTPLQREGYVDSFVDANKLAFSQTNVLSLGDATPVTSLPDEILEDSDFDIPCDEGSDIMDDSGKELSPGGVLDEQTVAQGLGNFGRSADGTQLVYLNCVLPGYVLRDISLLAEYVHLQRIELPYNELQDLSPLGDIPHLLDLDVSHNKISRVLNFQTPKNLRTVDFSFNCIEEIDDLSPHHYLQHLNLDNNNIREIKGLEKCQRLKTLSLAHNKIEKIQGLDCLPIRFLNLRSNQVRRIENLEGLKFLQHIVLSGNRIRSLKGLACHDFLSTIEIDENEVIDMNELEELVGLKMLRELTVLRNPVQELPDCRLTILLKLPHLTTLDRHRVELTEKVAAVNAFKPPPAVVAARDHMMNVVYNFLQPAKVNDSTLPSVDNPYPMLVLVGPRGAGKRDLALKLSEEFADYFGYGVSHTTRQPRLEEMSSRDYHFVPLENFEQDIKFGKFLQTMPQSDGCYGLQLDAIEAVAREGLACVVHMELEGVLTLKSTYLEPRYVLVQPLSAEAHERRLRQRGTYSEDQITTALQRNDMYQQFHQEHPGFFDMIISSDDLIEAYKHLRHLVMDYLGIAPNSPASSVAGDMDIQAVSPTMATNTHNDLGWSKTSEGDFRPETGGMSMRRAQTGSPLAGQRSTGKGVVEAESLQRRYSAARDAVSGHVPPLYQQVLSKSPSTAPGVPKPWEGQSEAARSGAGEAGQELRDQRSQSAPMPAPPPDMDAIPPGSPDSSTSSKSSNSSLSDISDTRYHREDAVSPDGSVKGKGLPLEKVNPIDLLGTAPPSKPATAPLTSEQPYGSYAASIDLEQLPTDRTGRPGSGKYPVIPPIGLKQTSGQYEY